MHWHAQPAAGGAPRRAEAAFGRKLQTRWNFDKANVVVAIDGDFLDPGPHQVGTARDWGEARAAQRRHERAASRSSARRSRRSAASAAASPARRPRPRRAARPPGHPRRRRARPRRRAPPRARPAGRAARPCRAPHGHRRARVGGGAQQLQARARVVQAAAASSHFCRCDLRAAAVVLPFPAMTHHGCARPH